MTIVPVKLAFSLQRIRIAWPQHPPPPPKQLRLRKRRDHLASAFFPLTRFFWSEIKKARTTRNARASATKGPTSAILQILCYQSLWSETPRPPGHRGFTEGARGA